ncbi:MAG TPA: tannase/feruloyl esterase family alpha/beta hydrolase [Solibacterales bacterium]|nr:tannase/feruloyl esterase family alpha/beta hydrolase [Bryobacterales bacterium]
MRLPIACLALALPLAAQGAPLPCERLLTLTLPHTTITTAESHPAGSFTPPAGKPIAGVPAFCRVAGSIAPSTDSDIRFEVWLPAANWNGKFQGIGNGGYAGTISFGGLAEAVHNGYATASTDTGHQDPGNDVTAAWALHHPEKIIDFGYRAIHETALAAKPIIAAFYGNAPTKSYFSSCSNGGRQALMEAQRFPADYDGIVAGAPANYWTRLLSLAASNAKATLAAAASYIPAAKLPAIEAAALAQCDAKDGVHDGVIENPTACRFDPSVLLCQARETASCLTAPQLTAVKAIYDGLRDGHGKLLFPGYSPGGEAEPGGWAPWITGDAPQKSLLFAFGTQFFKNMVYSDPAWQFRAFNPDADVPAAEQRMARYLNATDADLSAFEKRGGKLILYHGWADAAIPALNAINYYDSVVAAVGAPRAGNFVRLYMVPGMEHCGGGDGPADFGQGRTSDADPLHSVNAAIEAWVEHAAAPNHLIATKYRNDSGTKAVVRTRPLCAWPEVAKYSGSGSTDDAANFTCGK